MPGRQFLCIINLGSGGGGLTGISCPKHGRAARQPGHGILAAEAGGGER